MIAEHLAAPSPESAEEPSEHRWAVLFGDKKESADVKATAGEDSGLALLGGAYYAPESFADGVTNLFFIGCHPDYRGSGFGSELLSFLEGDCRDRGDRMLIVETSGTESFEKTRKFYRKNNYEEEGRIRDYYAFGDDKVTFRKLLKSPP